MSDSEPSASAGDEPRIDLHAEATADATIYQAVEQTFVEKQTFIVTGTPSRARAVGDQCPYPGMVPFTTAQSEWFRGRRDLVDHMVDKLADLFRTGGLLMVVAPSGAGKSSLLAAGLVPALADSRLDRSGHWPRLLFKPTADPLAELTGQLASATGIEQASMAQAVARGSQSCVELLRKKLRADRAEQADEHLVVIIDQFEELFTLSPQTAQDEARRRQFLDLLAGLAAAQPGERPPLGLVVCALRSDFYTRCAGYPQLRSALQENQIFVGPMSAAELRCAIEEPAEDVGLRVEPGLIGLLLRDLGVSAPNGGAQDAYEAGRLPLLAFVLPTLWRRRDGDRLTVDSYDATGGIREAVAKAAETVFAGFDPEDQRITKIILLRLVKIGEGGSGEDVQRRRDYADLVEGLDPRRAARVLDALTGNRLLTREQRTVEITHNALLHAWPRLGGWIKTDRAGNVLRQELEDNAEAWHRAGRDNTMLYRGNRLAAARDWARRTSHASELTPIASAFLAASVRQQHRTARRRRVLVAALTGLALVASGTAAYAFQQRAIAQSQLSDVVFHQVTSEAAALHSGNPELAAALDLVAYQMRPSDPTVRNNLTYTDNIPNTFPGGFSFAISHNGHMLATSDTVTGGFVPLRLLDISNPSQPRKIVEVRPGDAIPADAIPSHYAFSADDQIVANTITEVDPPAVLLWNIANPDNPVLAGQIPLEFNSIESIKFSPRGRVLAIVSIGTTSLWNVTDPVHPIQISSAQDPLNEAALAVYSPDGATLVTETGGALSLWDVTDPAHPALFGKSSIKRTPDDQSLIVSMAFSPDGHTVATSDYGGGVWLWSVTNPAKPVRIRQLTTVSPGGINQLAFSSDSHTLAIGYRAGNLLLWDVTNTANPALLGQPHVNGTTLADIAFSPDSPDLFVSSQSGIQHWHFGHLDQTIKHICTTVKNVFTPEMWRRYVGTAIPFRSPCEQ